MHEIPFEFPPVRRRTIRQQSRIAAAASYLPPAILTNQQIIDQGSLPVTDVVVRKTLGVEQRHVADAGLADSDLLAAAAERCLAKAGLQPDQVSKIIVTKFIGDHILPMTAAMVQRKLGCRTAMHAFDLEGGINSFLQALDLATRYISTTADPDQRVLLLSGGIQRAAVSKSDPRLAFLFGDGAAALLLEPAPVTHFLASYSYTNHRYAGAAGTVAMKMAEWFSEEIYEKQEYGKLYDWYHMESWKESADFYLEAARVTAAALCAESGLTMADVDLVLVTENNGRLRDLTLEALGVVPEKSLSLIDRCGNTMSAMLPLLIDHGLASGRLEPGMTMMLISHGEGASGGGMLYRF